MGKTLYLECTSGISGDMTAAALLDLGADKKKLEKVLKSLPVQGFTIKISRVKKSGIDACDFHVILDHEYENHDHDMEYLHGHERGKRFHEKEVSDAGKQGQIQEKSHGQNSHGNHQEAHAHEHRGMKEILKILQKAEMTDNARQIAIRIFLILAKAEAKAHHVPLEQVHFHEVGAVDSIVDIVSVAVCLDDLKISRVIVPMLCEGRGTVRCQHGILPVPVPAVVNIAQQNHLNLKITDVCGELVTPTGAAIAAAVRTSDTLPEHFLIEKTGIGAGKRQYACPGIIRAMIIREDTRNSDRILKLETNIDDCSGEVLGYLMEKLLQAGARDVHYQPVFMKKNRPAWQLTVLCSPQQKATLEDIIFRETTTIGIRYVTMERTVLQREMHIVDTVYGKVEVKVCRDKNSTYFYPEYESVAKAARERDIPYLEVYTAAAQTIKGKFK